MAKSSKASNINHCPYAGWRYMAIEAIICALMSGDYQPFVFLGSGV